MNFKLISQNTIPLHFINWYKYKNIYWTLFSLGLSILTPFLVGIPFNIILALMLVLTIHEMGHYGAMKYFGYVNINLIFLPLMGAVITTSTIKDSRINKIIVSIAGPLPGLIMGLILKRIFPDISSDFFRFLIYGLVYINAINLLPLAILDGGQIIENLFFNRSKHIAWYIFISGKLLFIYCILSKNYFLLPFYLFFFLRFYTFYTDPYIIEEIRGTDKLKPGIKIAICSFLIMLFYYLINNKFWEV